MCVVCLYLSRTRTRTRTRTHTHTHLHFASNSLSPSLSTSLVGPESNISAELRGENCFSYSPPMTLLLLSLRGRILTQPIGEDFEDIAAIVAVVIVRLNLYICIERRLSTL